MGSFVQQVRHAARSLARTPGFTITAAVTLATGIGLSVAAFTIADALLIRRLPVGQQDRLVVLWGETHDGRFSNWPLPLDDIREFQRRSHTLGDIAFFTFRGATPLPVRIADRVYPVKASLVSGNFFDVLRSRAAIGRALRPEDDVAGAAPVLVLSHRAWRQYFGGDSSIVGRSITLVFNGHPYTIVGVMPQGLEYPRGTDMWAPVVAYGAAGGFLKIISNELDILARLKPGASPANSRDELTAFFHRPEATAFQHDVRGVVHSFDEIVLGNTKPTVLLVTFAAALLLFITSVNVANLLLVRALGRVREFAVRTALGASRGRLVAQSLTESAFIAIAGGTLGVALGAAAVQAFVALAPAGLPRVDEIGVNRTALAAALMITTLAMLVSGVGPAVFTSRADAQDALRSGSRATGSRRVRIAAEMLVAIQIALATTSLTAAALMMRSFVALERADLSFDPSQLLVASLSMEQDQIPNPTAQRAALDLVLANVASLPGVRAVSPVLGVPFVSSGGGIDGHLSKPGQAKDVAAQNPIVNMEVAAPNYFVMLGVPIVRGRAFREDDREGGAPVVVVSSSVARHFWPALDPIGQALEGPGHTVTVVGVVPDTRYRELQTARPTVYFPIAQSPFGGVPSTLLIRTAKAPEDLVPALRRAVTSIPGVTLVNGSTLETLLDVPRAEPRLNAGVLVLFAVAAMGLAAIGLFAIIALMVTQRTHELGIRLALGATAGDVRRLVMGRGVTLAAVGAAVGIGGALATSRLLSSLLFGVSPTDPLSLLAVTALMIGVAAVATFVPAQTSMRIDPVIALRSDA